MKCPDCGGLGYLKDEVCESAIAGFTVSLSHHPVCDTCDGDGTIVAPHHPLNTATARQRMDAIHAFMLAWQHVYGAPPSLNTIADKHGPRSAGLLSIYMQRLHAAGRVRKLDAARGRVRWEAVAKEQSP